MLQITRSVFFKWEKDKKNILISQDNFGISADKLPNMRS
jgi:hypothetical protein